MAIFEINKFRGSFFYGRILLVSLILIYILANLYVITNLIRSYWCSHIIRFFPPDM